MKRGIAETMSLLWASHSREIGRTGKTINDLVDAAIALVAAGGIEALSVRHVAARLGVRPMAMYTAVPSKQDLVALMVDKAYRDLYPDGHGPSTSDWRAGLREMAAANRSLHLEHPWLDGLLPARSPMGPHETRKHELELRVIDRVGLADHEMDLVLTLVRTHVIQSARMETQLKREREESGLSDSEWWTEALPVAERVFDRKRFPLTVRVGLSLMDDEHPNRWADDIFAFGLERILDGVGATIAARQAS